MTDLSPAAQAVVTAIEKFDWEAGHFSREDIWMNSRKVTAAALRAAADQLTPYSVEDTPGAAFCRNRLLDIANELNNK